MLQTISLTFRISVPEDLKVNFLESRPLEMEGVACLEFWYLAPATAVGSELRALLKSRSGLVRIWTSPPLPRDAWRQVFLPLNITEPGTRVKWHTLRCLVEMHWGNSKW